MPDPAPTRARSRLKAQLPAALALLPALIIAAVAYVGAMLWTVRLSFSSTKMLPVFDWVGLAQYTRLFRS